MGQGVDPAGRGKQAWPVWWTPLELARRWAGLSREAGLEAVARISHTGDRLAAIDHPANRLARVVIEQLQGRDEAAQERLVRWLSKGARVDVHA